MSRRLSMPKYLRSVLQHCVVSSKNIPFKLCVSCEAGRQFMTLEKGGPIASRYELASRGLFQGQHRNVYHEKEHIISLRLFIEESLFACWSDVYIAKSHSAQLTTSWSRRNTDSAWRGVTAVIVLYCLLQIPFFYNKVLNVRRNMEVLVSFLLQ